MGFGSVGIRINVLRFPFREYWWKGSMITDMFTINVHARMVVYMYLIFVITGRNICNDGDKGCKFASVIRSLNLERLPGNKSLVCINAECMFRTDRRCWYICKLACSPVGKTDTLIKSHLGTKMKEKPVVYELLKLQIGKMTTVRTNTWHFGPTTVE